MRIYNDQRSGSLRGEKWADIPGFEDYYQASNLGRIRSLDRTIPHPRLGSQFVKGRVLRQKVLINKFVLDVKGKPMVDLSVCLMRDGRPWYINVRRLVWMAFRGALDFARDRKVVVNLDTDGYNNRLSNLGLWTEQEKSTRAATRGRVTDFLRTADRSNWKKGFNSKPVGKYSLVTGKLLKKYKSVSQASHSTGFDEKGIIACAKGRARQWRGFVWKYL
jgi:hypothetical protein